MSNQLISLDASQSSISSSTYRTLVTATTTPSSKVIVTNTTSAPMILARGLGTTPSFDPDAQAYFTAGNITQGLNNFQTAWNNWVVSSKAANIWDKISRVMPMCDQSQLAALLCAKTLTSMTAVNVTVGLAGFDLDAATQYLNTNFNPANSAGTQITSTSGFYGLWTYNGYTATDGTFFGANTLTALEGIAIGGGINASFAVSNNVLSGGLSGDFDNGSAYFVRRNGTTLTGYQDGSQIGINPSSTGVTPSTQPIYLGCNNSNGIAPSDFNGGLYVMWLASSYLNDAEFLALRTITRDFQLAVGKIEG